MLLVEADPALRNVLLRESTRVARNSKAAGSEAEAEEAFTKENFDIVIYDPGENFSIEFLKRCCAGRPRVIPVLILREPMQGHLDELIENQYLRNLIALEGSLSMREITATLEKLVQGVVLGLGPYLVESTKLKRIDITDSKQKERYIQEGLEALGGDKILSARMASKLGTIMDELIMNMMWDAPLDANGRHLFKHLARTERVQLAPEQAGQLTVGYDGRYVGLSAHDPFGGLRLDTVLRYFKKCFFGREQIGSEGGGAGLGLYLAYNYCSQFIINVEPGKTTEFVLLFDPSTREATSRNGIKSFHFFERKP